MNLSFFILTNVLANKIHITKDTKELLDKTGRFLMEKRGTIHIKVSTFRFIGRFHH